MRGPPHLITTHRHRLPSGRANPPQIAPLILLILLQLQPTIVIHPPTVRPLLAAPPPVHRFRLAPSSAAALVRPFARTSSVVITSPCLPLQSAWQIGKGLKLCLVEWNFTVWRHPTLLLLLLRLAVRSWHAARAHDTYVSPVN